MGVLREIAATRALRAGALVLVCGWAPLLLYALFELLTGQRGGNPVGLGLLLVFSTPLALLLLAAGVVQGVVAHWRSE